MTIATIIIPSSVSAIDNNAVVVALVVMVVER